MTVLRALAPLPTVAAASSRRTRIRACSGACRARLYSPALRGRAFAGLDRRDGGGAVAGRTAMMAHEFRLLRRILKAESGLKLAEDKQDMLEGKLRPLLKEFALPSLSHLALALLKPGRRASSGARGAGR